MKDKEEGKEKKNGSLDGQEGEVKHMEHEGRTEVNEMTCAKEMDDGEKNFDWMLENIYPTMKEGILLDFRYEYHAFVRDIRIHDKFEMNFKKKDPNQSMCVSVSNSDSRFSSDSSVKEMIKNKSPDENSSATDEQGKVIPGNRTGSNESTCTHNGTKSYPPAHNRAEFSVRSIPMNTNLSFSSINTVYKAFLTTGTSASEVVKTAVDDIKNDPDEQETSHKNIFPKHGIVSHESETKKPLNIEVLDDGQLHPNATETEEEIMGTSHQNLSPKHEIVTDDSLPEMPAERKTVESDESCLQSPEKSDMKEEPYIGPNEELVPMNERIEIAGEIVEELPPCLSQDDSGKENSERQDLLAVGGGVEGIRTFKEIGERRSESIRPLEKTIQEQRGKPIPEKKQETSRKDVIQKHDNVSHESKNEKPLNIEVLDDGQLHPNETETEEEKMGTSDQNLSPKHEIVTDESLPIMPAERKTVESDESGLQSPEKSDMKEEPHIGLNEDIGEKPPSKLRQDDSGKENSERQDLLAVGGGVEGRRTREEMRESKLEAIRAVKKRIREQRRKPITKSLVISSAGGKIELLGCQVEFQSGSLEKDTEITISVDNNPDSSPPDEFSITPVLECMPSMKFNEPVIITMTSRCLPEWGKTFNAIVMYKKKGMSKWETLDTVEVGNQGKLQFEVGHFCGYVGASGGVKGSEEYKVYVDVFASKETALIVFLFYMGKSNTHISGDDYAQVLFQPETLLVNKGDRIKLEIECKVPSGTTVSAYKESHFEINEKFLKLAEKQVNFEMIPTPPSDLDRFMMDCKVEHHNTAGKVEVLSMPLRASLAKKKGS